MPLALHKVSCCTFSFGFVDIEFNTTPAFMILSLLMQKGSLLNCPLLDIISKA
jgi:hypothetical protein